MNKENRVIAKRESGEKRGFYKTGDNWYMAELWVFVESSLLIPFIFTFIRNNIILTGGIGSLRKEKI